MNSMKRMSSKKINLQYKLMIIFILVFVLPFIVFGLFSLTNFQNILQKKTLIYNSDIIAHMTKSVEDYFGDIEKTARNLSNDNSFSSKIGKGEKDYEEKINYIKDNEEIFSKLSNILIQKKELISVYLYTRSDLSYCVNFEDTIDSQYSPQNENWYIQALNGDGPVLLSPRIDFQSDKKNIKVIPFICPVKLPSKGNTERNTGIIQFNVSPAVFYSLFGKNDSSERDIYIVDEYGNILYSNKNDLVATQLEHVVWNTIKKKNEGSFLVDENGHEKELVSYKTSDYTRWTVVLVTYNEQLTKDMANIKNLTVIFIIIIFILFVILSIIISRSISNPIAKLEKIVAQIKSNQFEIPLQIEQKQVGGLLSDHFNKLMDTINNLLKKINYHHQKEKEQERMILEAQINPHFIYNTLNAIRWMAAMQHADQIANAVKALINLLKSSIRIGETYISIEDEVKQIVEYIPLQQLRYYDSFEVEYDIDEEVKKFKTIKFVLQPIVENAIFHGLDPEEKRGRIVISIRKTGDVIQYCVSDNGKGMNEKTVSRLLDKNIYTKGFNGIGLNNVNERIKTYFGSQYGIEIESTLGCGTTVGIKIPAILFEEGEHDDKGSNS